jgi:hypothetical protein
LFCFVFFFFFFFFFPSQKKIIFVVFLADLFKRWNAGDYDHALSIVFFSRVFYASDAPNLPNGATRHRNGMMFVDHYREVVHMENRADWLTVIPEIKIGFSAMRQFLASAGGVNSLASEGNFLEAINLALNVFGKHYVDRDLRRTGQQIIVVTAGNGHFDVDALLSKLTKRRMMEGIGCDVMCLGARPLHAVPLFRLFSGAAVPPVFHVPSWFYVGFVQRRGSTAPGWSCRVRDLPFVAPPTLALFPCHAPDQQLQPEPGELGEAALLACNPFSNERVARAKPTASKRRWTNVYHSVDAPLPDSAPEVIANPNYRGLLQGINWDSITEPASLPLTTDYFPPDLTLKTLFTEHPYTMSLIPMENQYEDNPRLLLKEMVYQRLVHGYQIVTQKSRMFSTEEAADRQGMVAAVYYFSMAQDFQILSYDPLVSPHNVEVKIFHKIEDKDAAPEFEYSYNFWSGALDNNMTFRTLKANFRNDKMNYRLWNLLDRFVAGQTPPKDAFPLLKYWRVGFILIAAAASGQALALPGWSPRRPGNKGSSDVEWRKKAIDNFSAFRELLETTKLAKGQPRREMDIEVPGLAVAVTGAPGEVTGGPGKLEMTEISAVAKRMAIDASLIQDRRKGFRTYRDAILGIDCLEFILANTVAASVEEAQRVAMTMVQSGMLSMLRGSPEDFAGSVLKLVRVEPLVAPQKALAGLSNSGATLPASSAGAAAQQVVAPPNMRKFQRSETELALPRAALTSSMMRREPSLDDEIAQPASAAIAPLQSELLSDVLVGGPTAKSLNKIVVNMDSSTSDRYEWLFVAHDKTYHPNRTFYLVLEWTSCTGGAVQDFVQLLQRKAKACSLEMVQIPLNFYQRIDPFFLPVEIPFSVESLTDDECEAFQSAILVFSNFVLLQASSFEWVHSSGAAFVAVAENRVFQWYFNSLLIERDKGVASEIKQLLHNFRTTVNKFQRAFCGDKSVFSYADSADIFTVLSLCNTQIRPKLEALAVSAGLVSMDVLEELLKSR